MKPKHIIFLQGLGDFLSDHHQFLVYYSYHTTNEKEYGNIIHYHKAVRGWT